MGAIVTNKFFSLAKENLAQIVAARRRRVLERKRKNVGELPEPRKAGFVIKFSAERNLRDK